MNDSDKIINILVNMQGHLEKQGKDISDMKQAQARTNTALEALAEGQKDIRGQLDTKADKADIMDLRSDLSKKVKGNQRRLTNIEDKLDIPHPHKN